MPNKNNAHPTDLEDMPDETEELLFDFEDIPDETEELPFNLEDMPEFKFLLRTKSREFILETLPKVRESNKCGPDKALYILARSMGFTPQFLQDEKDITQLRRTLPTLNLNFPSKSSLSNYLALEKGLNFCFRHNDQTDELIIDLPGLTGELKTARFKNRLTMQMQGGRHVYYLNPNTTKVVNINRKKVTQFIEKKIRAAMKENWYGFDKVTMVYHTPIGRIDHFLQSILPQAEIKSRYGTAILSTSTKKTKERLFSLQIKGITAPWIQIQHISQNNQTVYLVTFSTTVRNFMEKIAIIHAFISRILSENAYLTRQIHRFVQVEHGEESAKKHLFPFTIYIEPFSFKDYYFSKFRSVHYLFFSFPKEIGKHGIISERVILVKSDGEQLTSLENLLVHNSNYMRSWSIRLLRTCIEHTRMVSTERLRQFLGKVMEPSIDQLINQLDRVYEQHQKEVEYYAEQERKRQAQMLKRFSYVASILLAIFTVLQGLQAIQWLLQVLQT